MSNQEQIAFELAKFRSQSAKFWQEMNSLKERERKAWLKMKKTLSKGN